MHHRSGRISLAASLALLACTTLAAGAQDLDDKRRPPKPKPDCLDGVKYDDTKLDSGVRPGSLAARGDFAMLFEAPSYPAKLNKVCVAWVAYSIAADLDVWFDLRIWAADGEDGKPGTLLATVPAVAAGRVPLRKPKFYSYDVSWANIVIDGPVYIGPSYDPLDAFLIYLGMDTGPRTQRQRGFYGGVLFSSEVQAPSTELGTSIDSIPSYRALGVRAVFGPP